MAEDEGFDMSTGHPRGGTGIIVQGGGKSHGPQDVEGGKAETACTPPGTQNDMTKEESVENEKSLEVSNSV